MIRPIIFLQMILVENILSFESYELELPMIKTLEYTKMVKSLKAEIPDHDKGSSSNDKEKFEQCYDYDLYPIRNNQSQQNCVFSKTILKVFPNISTERPVNLAEARQQFMTVNCQINDFCYSCCSHGQCLISEKCDEEYSILTNWAAMLFVVLVLLKFVISGLLIFYIFSTKHLINRLKIKFKELAANLSSRGDSVVSGVRLDIDI